MYNSTRDDSLNVNAAILSRTNIVTGVIVALFGAYFFNLLGAALGLSLFSVFGPGGFSLGSKFLVWLLLSSSINMYISGWFTTRFLPPGTLFQSVCQGLITCMITSLLLLILATTTAGSLMSSSLSAFKQAVVLSTKTVQAGSSWVPQAAEKIAALSPEATQKLKQSLPDLRPIIKTINEKANQLLPDLEENTATQTARHSLENKLQKLIKNYLNAPSEIDAESVKKDLVEVLAEATGKTPIEIGEKVKEWKAAYEEAKVKASEEISEEAKNISALMSKLAWANLLIMLFSLGSSALGAAHGFKTSALQSRGFKL